MKLKKKLTKLKWKLFRKLTATLGYTVYDPTVTWMSDESFLRSSGHLIAGIPDDRAFVLHDVARNIVNIPGDIAECGSRLGRSTRFILDQLKGKKDCRFHVFDSFEGLSAPTEDDRTEEGKVIWSKGDLASPVEVFEKNLADYMDQITVHQGWIPDRFGEVADKRFALVHVDVDLYDPTLQTLEFFYGRVEPGGVIICDDYGSSSCPGAKRAFDEFFQKRPESLFHLPTAQCIVVKQ